MQYLILFYALCLSFSVFAQERYITLDNSKIWINTIGIQDRTEGEPIIVFESGLGTPMGHWDAILEEASLLGPLITYDRPGVGASEPIDEMPTIKNVADRLVGILKHLDIDPPFLLVGHSLGGLYIRGFATYYPDYLAGLVIIDPADFTETHLNRRDYYEILNWEESEVDSLITSFITKRKISRAKAPESIQREGEVLEMLRENEFKEIGSRPLPNVPVHILTGGRYDVPVKFQSKEYDDEALFRSKMRHRVNRWTEVIQSVDKGMLFYSGDAGHFVHIDDPELVLASIQIALKDHQLLRENEGRH